MIPISNFRGCLILLIKNIKRTPCQFVVKRLEENGCEADVEVDDEDHELKKIRDQRLTIHDQKS